MADPLLKRGDNVTVTNLLYSNGTPMEDEWDIIGKQYKIEYDSGYTGEGGFRYRLEGCPNRDFFSSKELRKVTHMSDAKQLLREVKLTEDDRTLRHEGLEDSSGNLTSTGQAVLLDRLWATERTKVATELRAARAAEKAAGRSEDDEDYDD